LGGVCAGAEKSASHRWIGISQRRPCALSRVVKSSALRSPIGKLSSDFIGWHTQSSSSMISTCHGVEGWAAQWDYRHHAEQTADGFVR